MPGGTNIDPAVCYIQLMKLQYPVIHAFCRSLGLQALDPFKRVPQAIQLLKNEFEKLEIVELERQVVYAFANGCVATKLTGKHLAAMVDADLDKEPVILCSRALESAFNDRGELDTCLEIRRLFIDFSEALKAELHDARWRAALLYLVFLAGCACRKEKGGLAAVFADTMGGLWSPRMYLQSFVMALLGKCFWLDEKAAETRYMAFTYMRAPCERDLLVKVFHRLFRRHQAPPANRHSLFVSMYSDGIHVARTLPETVENLVNEVKSDDRLDAVISNISRCLPENITEWLPEQVQDAGFRFVLENYPYLHNNETPWASYLYRLAYCRVYGDFAFWAGLYQTRFDIFHDA